MHGEYELFSADKLPPPLRNTGGIAVLAGGQVIVSDNVSLEDLPSWVLHEEQCILGENSEDIGACLAATKEELRIVEQEKGPAFLQGYIRRRIAMLDGVLQLNFPTIDKHSLGDDESILTGPVRTILKVTGSINYLLSKIGDGAHEFREEGFFERLGREEEILKRFGHLVIHNS